MTRRLRFAALPPPARVLAVRLSQSAPTMTKQKRGCDVYAWGFVCYPMTADRRAGF